MPLILFWKPTVNKLAATAAILRLPIIPEKGHRAMPAIRKTVEKGAVGIIATRQFAKARGKEALRSSAY